MKQSTVLLGLLLTALTGCNGEKPEPGGGKSAQPSGASGAVDQAGKKVDSAVKKATDDRAALSPEEYEKLLLGLAKCSLKESAIDPNCPERKAWVEGRTRANALKDIGGLSGSLGKKHIKHESPAVRIQAAELLQSLFGTDKSGQAALLDAAKTEKEPAVLVAFVGTLQNEGKRNPDVGKFLLQMADHEAPMVRKRAMQALSSGWNRDMDGAVDKLIEKIDKDPDMSVREAACESSGSHGDDKLVAVYDRYTADPKKEPKLYAACMKGLIEAWEDFPLYETANEKAYKLTLKRLAYTPRSETVPPWIAIGDFGYLGKTDSRSLTEWKKKATWFKPAELQKLLEAVVEDPKANWMARKAALDSMVGLGTDKATLTRMKAKYKDAKEFGDKSLVEALDKAMATAK